MTSIRKDISIDDNADRVWDAVRDVGAVHRRLASGFVTDTQLDGGDRIVTFANGAVVREALIDVDPEARRVAYSVVESPLGLTHHNASMQVVADGEDASYLVWITDLLPDSAATAIGEMIEQGATAMRQTLSRVG